MINTESVLHQIDINIYGHFLEHIYNSVNGGLWGDLIWNRSFEMINSDMVGDWSIEGNTIVQSSLNDNVRLLFGEISWEDYEITLQAKKLGGNEGFLVIFRANGENFYWANIGGWNNTQHAIEKGVPGVRWDIFNGEVQPGSVNSDVWYDIKIRCEGNHFQVWLDDVSLFDFTDSEAHLSGQAGIGTWITKAAYRNIVVTSITSGDTIYNQLPEIPEEDEVDFRNWEKSENAYLYRTGAAFNSDYSLVLENPQHQEAWIQQDEINIIPQTYYGSFWAKAEVGTHLKVKLMQDVMIMDEAEFTVNDTAWQEYSFEFNPQSSVTRGILQIAVADSGTVCLDQVSMTGQDCIDNDGFRPDLLKAVKDLQPPIIRWPGGCYASAYFWKDGIGPQHERVTYPIELWNDRDVNSYGTDEFLRMCEITGAEPLIVINSGVLDVTCGAGIVEKLTPEQYLQDALDWMEYCNGDETTTWGAVRAANGHPEPYNVKYWEIDNETWSAGVDAYIEKVKTFAPAMQEKYPDVKIIACGSGGFNYNWNIRVISECAHLIDYISTHHYEDVNNYRTGVASYEDFVVNLSSTIAQSANPDMEIYMSEWNVWSPIDWRSGLYAGGMLNMFERQGKTFTLGGPALWLRHSNAEGNWNNAFINFNNSTWFSAPNYVVMKLWREHYATNYLETTGNHSALNVVSTLSKDSSTVYIKVVNTMGDDLPLTFTLDSSFIPDSAILKKVIAPSLYSENSFQDPDLITVQNGVVMVNEQEIQFASEGYSAIVVEIKRCDTCEHVINSAPTDLFIDSDSVQENLPAGTLIGTFSTEDIDVDDTHTYSLVPKSDDEMDNASFIISGSKLQSAEMFDYETQNVYDIYVRTDDGNGGTFHKQFAIRITNDPDEVSVEHMIKKKFRVYPNYASERIFVDIDPENTGDNVRLKIVDMKGQLCKSISLSGREERLDIDITDLTEGIYALVLQTEKSSSSVLFMKE